MPVSLPALTPEESAHERALVGLIRREIDVQGGAIGFARFMELALYAPGLGYYSATHQKFGAGGDFITAPELGALYARCLARCCAEVLTACGGDVLEAGAGSGALAADLLAELAALNSLPDTYYILELSATLRMRQQALIQARVPALAARVHWLSRLPARFRGVVIGNEVLDAMPVERFRVTADGIDEFTVIAQGEGLAWGARPAGDAVIERIAPLDLAPGYSSEINLAAEAWVRTVADALVEGLVLLIDYGFPRAEFYHSDRTQGTLMCHYRQRAHADPLIRIGLQDITAHVDFTAIAEAAVTEGLELLGYTSQAAFLIGSGLPEFIARSDPNDTRAHLELTQQIKKLTSPAEMGELFKVLALGRGISGPLSAFALADRRGRL